MSIVCLISCASGKRGYAAEARDLYNSPLFNKARAYAEKFCDRWFILSAKYGLVRPSQVIEPYEETLNAKPRVERKQWAERVWTSLHPRLRSGDRVIVLAGEPYREFLVQPIIQHGCRVDVPMEGLGIGRQLQWLARQLSQPTRERDLDRLYGSLADLDSGLGGKRLMLECTGQQDWPRNGVYFYFEPGEGRCESGDPRVVRVGTHGVSRGSKATLWNRLRTHRGSGDGLGNHRSSIFRLHVGAALASKDAKLAVSSWGIGQSADAKVRKREERLERAVSRHIGAMSILWLAIEDEASAASDRAYIERNLIGLFVGKEGGIDRPSPNWLGLFSPVERIRNSGLWNLDFLNYSYSSEFLDVLDEYVLITIGKRPKPLHSIAPRNWYANDRQGVRNQLPLFGD